MLRAAARFARALLLAVCVVVLTGCRLDVVAPITLHADGTSTAGLTARFDPRLLAELDALGVDPTAELSAAVAAEEAWSLTRTRDEDGALTVAVRRDVPDDAELAATYAALSSGLAAEDPALELALEVDRDEQGGVRLSGTGSFRPPLGVGLEVDGAAVGEDAEALAAMMAEAVEVGLEVRMPGVVTAHDGVAMDASTVRVDLEPGVERRFAIRSDPAPWWASLPIGPAALLVGVGLTAVVLGLVAVFARRRRVSPEA
ncbi:MAG: hypothetical protein R6V28_10040 [Nitriliruptoraceae bacterium]